MVQATRLAVRSLILLTITVKRGGAAERQFSCKGQVIQGDANSAVRSKPIDQESLDSDALPDAAGDRDYCWYRERSARNYVPYKHKEHS